MKKMFPVGIENFREMREDNYYYVDKTGLIRDLLRRRNKVNLFTRPRRFGKTLNMSMLKYFFEIGCDGSIFDGLAISEETELCRVYQGKFPVIFVSLKGINGSSFESAKEMFCSEIGSEAHRFHFLLESEALDDTDKEMYKQLVTVGGPGKAVFEMTDATLTRSLRTLSGLLEKHYGSKVIVLIDEYDIPLAKAYANGYYDEMVLLIRNMFEQVLKTNDSLYFAVLTGCMRISLDASPSLDSKIPRQVSGMGVPAKLENTSLSSHSQSIFTGLNNLSVMSVADVAYEEYFGFTESEVKALLDYYDLSDHYQAVRDWYDGYQFGNANIYCPWDVLCYSQMLLDDPEEPPQNFWINTSDNESVRRFIREADNGTVKRDIECLVAGETIRREIHQELTYRDMYSSIDHLWSVLFTTGYLTQRGKRQGNVFELAIPNLEIRSIYTSQIMDFFKENTKNDGDSLRQFCCVLEDGNAPEVEKQFTAYLKKTISIRDTFVKRQLKENFYHGILLGILGFKNSWVVSSNKETGEGYGDILIEIEEKNIAIIIEVKYAEGTDLEKECHKALQQIENRNYEDYLRQEGYQKILKYGIACRKKLCRVMLKK